MTKFYKLEAYIFPIKKHSSQMEANIFKAKFDQAEPKLPEIIAYGHFWYTSSGMHIYIVEQTDPLHTLTHVKPPT